MNQEKKVKEKKPSSAMHKPLTILGIVLCVILVPILIINCTLIIKSAMNSQEAPDIAGITPFIVLTDSMSPVIESGDIIITKKCDFDDVKVGDVITFYDPASKVGSVVTHRVMYFSYNEETGTKYFRTAGDYNVAISNGNAENEQGYDMLPVGEDDFIGVWTEIRIPNAGHVALFMQTTTGLIVCVLVPLLLLLGYELFRRRKADVKKTGDMAALMAELEALRAGQATETAATPEAPEVSEVPEAPVAEAPAEETAPTAEKVE